VIVGGRVIGIFGLGYGKFSVPSGGLEGKVLEGLVCTDVTLQRHSLLQVVQMGTLWFANYLSRFGPNVRSSELGRRRCAL
jgi:hypothetical protein